MENKNISVDLPVAVWNVIMNALGQRPFAEVVEIIEAIRQQAGQQLQEAPEVEATEAPVAKAA